MKVTGCENSYPMDGSADLSKIAFGVNGLI